MPTLKRHKEAFTWTEQWACESDLRTLRFAKHRLVSSPHLENLVRDFDLRRSFALGFWASPPIWTSVRAASTRPAACHVARIADVRMVSVFPGPF